MTDEKSWNLSNGVICFPEQVHYLNPNRWSVANTNAQELLLWFVCVRCVGLIRVDPSADSKKDKIEITPITWLAHRGLAMIAGPYVRGYLHPCS